MQVLSRFMMVKVFAHVRSNLGTWYSAKLDLDLDLVCDFTNLGLASPFSKHT